MQGFSPSFHLMRKIHFWVSLESQCPNFIGGVCCNLQGNESDFEQTFYPWWVSIIKGIGTPLLNEQLLEYSNAEDQFAFSRCLTLGSNHMLVPHVDTTCMGTRVKYCETEEGWPSAYRSRMEWKFPASWKL